MGNTVRMRKLTFETDVGSLPPVGTVLASRVNPRGGTADASKFRSTFDAWDPRKNQSEDVFLVTAL